MAVRVLSLPRHPSAGVAVVPLTIDVREGISDADLPEVAEVLSDAFAEYPFTISFTARTLHAMFGAEDVRSEACRLAHGNGRLVGVGLAALRGDHGRVAAMGVGRDAHRTGVGRAVGESLLAGLAGAGARDVVLEALTVNAPALALYEGPLGFDRRRRLVGFTRACGGPSIASERWDEALAAGGEPDSWQLRRVVRRSRETSDLVSVPPVVPERHPVADLLRKAGFEHAEIAQYELGRPLP
ncbi:MAG: GNAT family N-acetyltransferase [Solirubrobacteraceae bacterium]